MKYSRIFLAAFVVAAAFLLAIPLTVPVYADSVDLYWVGGSGNWSQTAHWSASSGGAGGHAIPTSSNTVHFDNLSYNNNYIVTQDTAGAACKDMIWGNPSVGTPGFAGSSTLSVYGSLTKVSGMSWTYSGTLTFASTATGKTITSNGVAMAGAVTFNGAAGGWQLQDDFSTGASTLTLTNGTLDTNGKTVTTGNFATVSGTSTLTLGATVWNGGGNWTATYLGTLNANSSSLRFTGSATQFTGHALTYYDVEFNGPGAAAVLDANTFQNLQRNGTTAINDSIVFSASQTVNGTLTIAGNSAANRVAVKSNTTTARTLTAAITSVSHGDFYYIQGAGPANWNFAGNSDGAADMGGNVNLILSAQSYWVGNGGNWVGGAAAHWSGTSGGTANSDWKPVSTTSAIFDANSFSGIGQTVTIDSGAACKNLDGHLSSYAFTLSDSLGTSQYMTINGDFILPSGSTIADNASGSSGGLEFSGTANIINTPNVSFTSGSYYVILLFQTGANYSLNSNFDSSGGANWSVELQNNASLNTNGYTFGCSPNPGLNVPALKLDGSGSTITFGSSTINFASNSNATLTSFGSGTVSPGSSIISILSPATFDGGGNTFHNLSTSANNVTFANAAFNDVTTTGSGYSINTCTFHNLTISGANSATDTLTFMAGSSNSFSGTFFATGYSQVNRLLIHSSTDGTQYTLNSSGTNSFSNVDIRDAIGTGSNGWDLSMSNAGDATHNSNITFKPGINYYWYSNTGNYSDATKWWTQSGGGGSNGTLPLLQDTAVFNSASFTTTGQIVTMDMIRTGKLTAQQATNSPTFAAGSSNTINLYQNIYLGNDIWTASSGTYTYGLNNQVLDTGTSPLQSGTTITGPLYIYNYGQNLTLNNDLVCSDVVYLVAGIFNTNNHNVTARAFDSYTTTTYARTFAPGASTLTFNNTVNATYSIRIYATNFTLASNTATVVITNSTTNAVYAEFGGVTGWNNLTLTGSGAGTFGIGTATLGGTFLMDRSAAKTLKPYNNVTRTITAPNFAFPLNGTTAITVTSSGNYGLNFTKTGGGTVVSDYLVIDHSAASPTSTFYAGAHATNNGNNSGWVFTDVGTPGGTTLAATGITTGAANLNGSLDSIDSQATVYLKFEWGSTDNYGSSTIEQTFTAAGPVTQALSGLTSSTTYHYRLDIRYGSGNYIYCNDQQLTTLPSSGSTPTVMTTGYNNLAATTVTLLGNLTSLGAYSSVDVSFQYGADVGYGSTSTVTTLTATGYFSIPVTGLTTGVTYHFRAQALYNDTAYVYGADNSFTTSSAPSVATLSATSITPIGATLQGQITSMGGYTSVYVCFEYGTTTGYGTYTVWQPETAATTFSYVLSGVLSPNTSYHFRADLAYGNDIVVDGSDGTFTTGSPSSPSVTTGTATNIATTSATLQGTLTSIGSYTSIVVYFEYGTSVSYGTSTAAQTLTASSLFQTAITGLNNNVTYHFRADAAEGSTILNGNDATFVAGQGNWTKVVSGNSNTAYWNMVGSTPTAPTYLYTELGTGFLFGGFLQMVSNDSGIPLALIVFPYAFYISLLLGLVAYVLSMGKAGKDTAGRRPYRGSLPLMAIVSGLSMTYFIIAGGGVIPGWSLIPYGFWAVASIIFRQNQEGRGW